MYAAARILKGHGKSRTMRSHAHSCFGRTEETTPPLRHPGSLSEHQNAFRPSVYGRESYKRCKMQSFDIIIIGGGIAGLTAAIYAGRAGRKTAVIESNSFGGVLNDYEEIENYPGIGKRKAIDLAAELRIQAQASGATFIAAEVSGCSKTGNGFTVYTQTDLYSCRSIIIATGIKRKTNPMFDKMLGHGVSYCATCDGFFYKDKTVAVYGSGYTALDDALYLSGLCKKVVLLCPKNRFAASDTLSALMSAPNVDIHYNATVTSLSADSILSGLEYMVKGDSVPIKIPAEALFVALGYSNSSSLINGLTLTPSGAIQTEQGVRTSLPGVFAAGDCTDTPLRQAVTAAAQGALAASFASEYLNK